MSRRLSSQRWSLRMVIQPSSRLADSIWFVSDAARRLAMQSQRRPGKVWSGAGMQLPEQYDHSSLPSLRTFRITSFTANIGGYGWFYLRPIVAPVVCVRCCYLMRTHANDGRHTVRPFPRATLVAKRRNGLDMNEYLNSAFDFRH